MKLLHLFHISWKTLPTYVVLKFEFLLDWRPWPMTSCPTLNTTLLPNRSCTRRMRFDDNNNNVPRVEDIARRHHVHRSILRSLFLFTCMFFFYIYFFFTLRNFRKTSRVIGRRAQTALRQTRITIRAAFMRYTLYAQQEYLLRGGWNHSKTHWTIV
jgi:hypothetical protein